MIDPPGARKNSCTSATRDLCDQNIDASLRPRTSKAQADVLSIEIERIALIVMGNVRVATLVVLKNTCQVSIL